MNRTANKTSTGVALLVAALLAMGANVSIAGEVNGRGEVVPGGQNGRSECSYSGLQDDAAMDEGIFRSDRTQNWGQLTELGRWVFATFLGITRADQGCNPNRAGG